MSSTSTMKPRRSCAPPPTRTQSAAPPPRCWPPTGQSSNAGQGVLYAEATEELRQVAEFLQAPVMTTMAGKSGFPENHPLSVGTGATSIPEGVHHYLTRSDLVFGIGCSFSKTNFGAPNTAGEGSNPLHQRRHRHQQGLQVSAPAGRRLQTSSTSTLRGIKTAGWFGGALHQPGIA